jgi:hypothetical protein|tara:strand:+ start:56 stop:673 length:618 start_codon:yes stop_codon:yes gene_type:complete
MGVISNGTTLLDAGALDSGIATGAMTLIKTLTASGATTLSFLNGADNVVFDDTYDVYVFKFINVKASNRSKSLTFQVDTGTNTNYNIAVTSTGLEAYQNEAGNSSELRYDAQYDNPNSTGFVQISSELQNDADSSGSGELVFYNPSSGTFVKHWTSTSNNMRFDSHSYQYHKAGYFNTTTALTRVQFKINANTFDGTIKMYGIGG